MSVKINIYDVVTSVKNGCHTICKPDYNYCPECGRLNKRVSSCFKPGFASNSNMTPIMEPSYCSEMMKIKLPVDVTFQSNWRCSQEPYTDNVIINCSYSNSNILKNELTKSKILWKSLNYKHV